MSHFQPAMNPADNDQPVIDLESSGIIYLEHARVCGGNPDDSPAHQRMEIVEPQATPRCQTSDREILRTRFTDV